MNRKLSKPIIGVFAGALMLTTAIGPAGAQSRALRSEASRLSAMYTAATPGSAAQFRIHEELDRLAVDDAAHAHAPASAAAFRLAEMQSR